MTINKSYIICSIGRSGSTLLASTFGNLGNCGNPEEYFHENRVQNLRENNDVSGFRNYLEEILGKGVTDNGVFGMKMHWHHMRDFLQFSRKKLGHEGKTDLEILNYFFPNPNFIYIRRENIVKQAVSTAIAQQTDIWEKPLGSNTNKQIKPRKFSPLAIYGAKQGIRQREEAWREFFRKNSLDVYEIVYENFCQSIENNTIDMIKFLKIEPLPEPNQIKVSLQKQSNHINDRWEQYYNLIPENLLKNYSQFKGLLKRYLN